MAVKKLLAVSMLFAAAQAAHAADIEAGRQLANAVCAACHGSNGISVAATIPNLAGQHAPYLEAQIKAFKDGTRKQPGLVNQTAIMSAIATQLSPADTANVAAFFAAQPGPAAGAAQSAPLPDVAETHVALPAGSAEAVHELSPHHLPARQGGALLLRQPSRRCRGQGRQAVAGRLGALRRGLFREARCQQQSGRRCGRLLPTGQAGALHRD